MENEKILLSGSCGEEASFTVTEYDGGCRVHIFGYGEMTDYSSENESPFYEFKDIITDVYVEKNINGIGDYAFKDCAKLSNLRIAGSVKYIGTYSFSKCLSLKNLFLPEGLEIIGPKSFEKCSSLEKLRLPSTLCSIDFKAFNNIDNELKIRYNGSEKQWKTDVKVSPAVLGNKSIFNASFAFTKESSHFRKMLSGIAGIIKKGGDGYMHVLAPDLTVPGIKKKSGDCTFIVFPKGQTMLIDTGVEVCSERFMSFFSSLGLKTLDWFVITHPHGDHIGNATEAAKYICETSDGTIKNYVYSGYVAKNQIEPKLREYLTAHGTNIISDIRSGDSFDIDGVHIDVINPDDEVLSITGNSDNIVNNTSVCMKFTFGKASFMAAGDLYADREKELVRRYGSRLHTDLMKANHHSAYTSNTPEWLAAVRPKYILSEEDGVICTRLLRRIEKAKIKNYPVSDRGLVSVTLSDTGTYRFKTEY